MHVYSKLRDRCRKRACNEVRSNFKSKFLPEIWRSEKIDKSICWITPQTPHPIRIRLRLLMCNIRRVSGAPHECLRTKKWLGVLQKKPSCSNLQLHSNGDKRLYRYSSTRFRYAYPVCGLRKSATRYNIWRISMWWKREWSLVNKMSPFISRLGDYVSNTAASAAYSKYSDEHHTNNFVQQKHGNAFCHSPRIHWNSYFQLSKTMLTNRLHYQRYTITVFRSNCDWHSIFEYSLHRLSELNALLGTQPSLPGTVYLLIIFVNVDLSIFTVQLKLPSATFFWLHLMDFTAPTISILTTCSRSQILITITFTITDTGICTNDWIFNEIFCVLSIRLW